MILDWVLEQYVSKNDEVERIITAEGLAVERRNGIISFVCPSSICRQRMETRSTSEFAQLTNDQSPNRMKSGKATGRSTSVTPPKHSANNLSKKKTSGGGCLKLLQEELNRDAEQGQELLNQLWKDWNKETQQSTRELSEKEQTQSANSRASLKKWLSIR